MVSIEELLRRVQQAETETDRQWVLLEMQMSQMSEDLVSMLWASAIPHFFDAEVLAALRPELGDSATDLYVDLQALTFVETFPGRGCNVHELTREVLLSRLWTQDRTDFLVTSQRAAEYFFDAGTSLEEEIEFCYHEILNEKDTQTSRLLERVFNWWIYNQPDYIQSAIQCFMEHESSDRLDTFGHGLLLYLKGLLKMRSASYEEAETLFTRAQSNYSLVEIKDPRYTSTLLRDLSRSKEKRCDYKGAMPISEQALKISEEQLGENHPDTATSLDSLASLYEDTGRYERAETLYLRALSIREEQLGENHPNTASSLNNSALLYESVGQYGKAELLHLRALSIFEEQLGENHPDTATSLNGLASLYGAMGQYERAEALQIRALSIRKDQLGENHPDTASSSNNLASLYTVMGQYEKAETLQIRALGTFKERLGEDHPDTVTSLSNLVELYRMMGRDEEAISTLERWRLVQHDCQATRTKLFAIRTVTLGKLYEKHQRLPEAVATYEEALSLFNRLLGSKDQRTMVLSGELKRLKKRMSKKPKRRT